MTNSVPRIYGHKLSDVYKEVDKISKQGGHEDLGGLGFAREIFAHFKEKPDPIFTEAFRNLDTKSAVPKGTTLTTQEVALA